MDVNCRPNIRIYDQNVEANHNFVYFSSTISDFFSSGTDLNKRSFKHAQTTKQSMEEQKADRTQ